MKKTLLSLLFLSFGTITQAQNLLVQNFDSFTALATAGWTNTNQSSPLGASTWAQGGGTAFGTGGFNGGATSFTLCNFNSTTGGTGTISNWLITPVVSLQNGDIITFYSRAGGTGTGTVYADRLELRISTNGAATVSPTGGSAGLGDFTTVALTINPNLTSTGYPFTWTQYSYTVSGLTGVVPCKLGFRYFVTNGGPDGLSSNIIGLDALSIDRPTAGTSDFFAKNFSVYPNPSTGIVNLASKNNAAINAIQLTDLNGRVVKNLNANGVTDMQINISDLTSGVYFLNIETELGSGTTKIVKN